MSSLEEFQHLIERDAEESARHGHLVFTLPPGIRPEIEELCERHRILLVDEIEAQLREWIRCQSPSRGALTPARVDELVAAVFADCADDPAAFGSWVYYPWRRQLVHLLPESAFQLVRRNRNRNKITLDEQARLRAARVGVVGLSVGHAAAVLLAREGIGKELRIADFDHLELSNLNRLCTSLSNLGMAKSAIAQRDIAEVDPYLDVGVFADGVTAKNVDAFLVGGGALDVVIEECDTLWIKLLVREQARHHGIPVVMDTNDRGMLDIERFDVEPARPIFHGYLGDCDAEAAREMDAAQRMELFYSILGGPDMLSPRLRESLRVIGDELVGIPQLASDVYLGAALAVDATRKILLDAGLPSGRYYVDLDALLRG